MRTSTLRVALTAVAVMFVGLVWGGRVGASSAAGPAEIVAPGSTTPLAGGGSSTSFGVLLPAGARCPADSTKRPWYRAGSYLVPKGVDPATVNFRGLLPDRGLFLVAFGAPWEHQNVVKDSAAVLVPEYFDVQRFTSNDVLPGGSPRATWEAGIACVNDTTGVVAKYWNVEVTFTSTKADPSGWTWTARRPSHLDSSGSSWPFIVGVGGIIVAAVLSFVVLNGRPRRRDNASKSTRRTGRGSRAGVVGGAR